MSPSQNQPRSLDGLFFDGPIDRVAASYKIDEEPSEVEAWAFATAEQRWNELLSLRTRMMRWTYGAEQRLERVLKVTRRP